MGVAAHVYRLTQQGPSGSMSHLVRIPRRGRFGSGMDRVEAWRHFFTFFSRRGRPHQQPTTQAYLTGSGGTLPCPSARQSTVDSLRTTSSAYRRPACTRPRRILEACAAEVDPGDMSQHHESTAAVTEAHFLVASSHAEGWI